MEYSAIQNQMRALCQTKNWRTLIGIIDDGYRGMYVILRILQEEDAPVAAGELAKRMNVSTARIARALNTLERKAYIVRENDEKDARKVVIRMTAEGERALETRKQILSETLGRMFDRLTDAETVTLFFLLKKLLQ